MLALLGRGLAGPARAGAAVLGRAELGCSPVLQAARGYARPVTKKRKDIPSHLDDLPPTMLKKDYANLPVMSSVDDVVKRLLSLEMASQREKLKVKTQQLVEKVRRSPNDNGSFEVQVAILTAKIRTLEEHLQRHPKVTQGSEPTAAQVLFSVNNKRSLILGIMAFLRRFMQWLQLLPGASVGSCWLRHSWILARSALCSGLLL
ncbi:28S ribosomal protein S15, mitochondrial [Pyrgilauda ruficollis]|uniref:28S ribosomal protein S15, mitochondrial n=1 Tax=Pyrgilauda ruficollis TaxID=221976 RepID=UPI001B8814E0|nr:28S ribosomal protein S15, mitochondrial [Pyrgilauda ruficollis]